MTDNGDPRGENTGADGHGARPRGEVAGAAETGTNEEVEPTVVSPSFVPADIGAAIAPGGMVGRFRLSGRIGQGGMGEVWKAWDTQLGRWVAVKLLKVEDPLQVQRFVRETTLLARLQHPNVVQVYDAGVHGGRPYLVMEYVECPAAGFKSVHRRRAAEIVCEAARGVAHAHAHGIVHRDLKPSNLLESTAGRVYVTDFGLAKVVEAVDMTVTGAVLGTPSFMAPEQALGRPADERTDVYGLGATLYALVEGRPPFQGESMAEIIGRVAAAPAPRLSGDDDLVVIVARATERERADRYGSADELADDLDRYLRDEPVLARPIGPVGRVWRRARRRPRAAAGLAALALAVVVGMGWAGAAALAAHRRSEQGRAAQGMLSQAEAILTDVRRMQSSDQADTDEYQQAVSDLEELTARAVGVAPELARAHYDHGLALLFAKHWEDAEAAFSRALELDPGANDARARRAYARYSQVEIAGPTAVATSKGMEFVHNPPDPAGAAHLEGAASDWHALPESHPDRAYGEALLAFAAGDYAAARKVLESRVEAQPYLMTERRMLAQADLVLGDFAAAEHHSDLLLARGFEEGTVYAVRAYARAGQGRFEAAVADMRASLERRPDERSRRNYVAFWLYQLGRSEEALAEYEQLVASDPDNPTYLTGRSNARMATGDWAGAVADADRVVELQPESSEAHYQRAVTLNHGPGAIEEFSRSIELDPNNLTAVGQRGLALVMAGRWAEAERDGRLVVAQEPEFPHWKYVLGAALRGLGRWQEAIDVLDAGIAQGLEYPEVYTDRARARAALGQCAGAWDDLDRAKAFNEGLNDEAVAEIRTHCPR